MNNNQSIYTEQSRFSELDALRGIAAFIVVIWHFFCATYVPNVESNLSFIYLIVHGRASVILFFILSGFVLSLPYFKETQPRYWPFVIRRICRIYLPYLVGIIMAIVVRTFFTVKPLPGMGEWFNNYCGDPFSLKIALENIFLIGNIHSDVYNNAIWSLIHEMRISLIFPFLLLFVNRVKPGVSILTCVLLSGVAQLNELLKWEISNGWESGYFYSLHIASFFIIGILLAKHKGKLVQIYRSIKKPLKISIFIIALILFRASMDLWRLNYNLFLLFDYGSVVSACVFMIISLGSLKASKFLNKPAFSFLGKISYSMYLNHITILYLVFFILYPSISVGLIGLIFILSVIVFSYLSWRYIERPSIALGKMLSNKIDKRPATIK